MREVERLREENEKLHERYEQRPQEVVEQNAKLNHALELERRKAAVKPSSHPVGTTEAELAATKELLKEAEIAKEKIRADAAERAGR